MRTPERVKGEEYGQYRKEGTYIHNLPMCGPRKDQNTCPHLSELRSMNYTVTMRI